VSFTSGIKGQKIATVSPKRKMYRETIFFCVIHKLKDNILIVPVYTTLLDYNIYHFEIACAKYVGQSHKHGFERVLGCPRLSLILQLLNNDYFEATSISQLSLLSHCSAFKSSEL